MNKSVLLAWAAILGLAVLPTGALGRGFGGFHGSGGGGGGGNRGGGFEGGGNRGGGSDGYHASGYGGYHAGSYGGYHASGYGGYGGGSYRVGGSEGYQGGYEGGSRGTASRSQLNSFLGMPTDGGMQAAGRGGYAASPKGLVAGRAGAAGSVHEGPGGTTVAHGTAGARGVAVGPGGAAAGGGVVHGTAVKGPEGNVYYHGGAAGRGVAAGPGGVVAGRGAAYGRGVVTASGMHHFSPTYAHAQAIGVHGWYGTHHVFTPTWGATHAWAWRPAGYTAAAWSTACWNAPAWPSVGAWFGWNGAPYDYIYGDNITYEDDRVYYDSQPVATAEQYYTEASDLADSGADVQNDEDEQWMPLGVFGLVEGDNQTPEMTFQLAVSRDGVIRGNCIKPSSDNTLDVRGGVDEKTQRAAWMLDRDKSLVVETGLYNLTKDEAPALLHRGPDQTAQVLLVRITQPDAEPNGQ